MQAREAGILAVIVIVVLAALAVVAGGLFSVRVSIEEVDSPGVFVDPPEDGNSGTIFDLHRRDAQRLLGITYRGAEHHAHVAVVVPRECISTSGSGDETLRDDGPCADLPIRGELVGGGTSGEGHEFVFVRVPISEDCFNALERGTAWPSTESACNEP